METFRVEFDSVNGGRRTSQLVSVTARPAAPIVLLLHGNNGDSTHMTNPSIKPGYNFDCHRDRPARIDRGIHGYPNAGIWSVGGDPLREVTGWEAALQAQGIGTAVYSQCDNADLLADPARELEAVVRKLTHDYPSRSLVLLAHSRGGLLARRFLLNVANDRTLISHIAALVTLHSSHQGTSLPTVANTLRPILATLALSYPPAAALLLWLQIETSAKSYLELVVDSPFLKELAAGEQDAGAPLVPTHTFGGTSTRFTRLRSWVFTPESAVPQFTKVWPPRMQFHWVTVRQDLPAALSDFPELSVLAPELSDGLGDSLVSDARSRLPWAATHTTNRLNHAEALWDEILQEQVLNLIHAAAPLRPLRGAKTLLGPHSLLLERSRSRGTRSLVGARAALL